MQAGTSSLANQKAGAGMDSAESGACGACDSAPGERQPRRARNQSWDQSSVQRPDKRSDQSSDQRSDQRLVPRLRFLQRWRSWALPPQHRWRRGGFEQRDRRPSNSSSTRSSLVRRSSVVTNQVVVSKSRRMPGARARPGTITGDHKSAQLCFACRSRAKVSSFPLADRLAERTRACRSPAK